MRLIILTIFIILPLIIYGGSNNKLFQYNNQKLTLMEKSFQHVDSLENERIEEKSVFMATLYSAILPGAGEYYAESYWKAAMFAGLEVVGWTVHLIYDAKGNKQDERTRAYADQHWDERRYWSRLYYEARIRGDIQGLPNYETYIDDDGSEILVQYDSNVVNSLRFLEGALGHTHSLPKTKTQQYYEMIYKYLGQFGNGWDDADFYGSYSGYTDDLTPNIREYRENYNLTEEFYDIATSAANAILLNHVISAIDAALTTRNYNKSLRINVGVNNRYYLGEKVRMYSLNISW